ncbi:MAG: HD domain-containing phosphohydrolase [Syntrophobacteraceae bacterium]
MRKEAIDRLSPGYRVASVRFGDPEEVEQDLYFPISPFMIFPEACPDFGIYLKKGKNYLLLTRQEEEFNSKHKRLLHENGILEVYIHSSQKPGYDLYLEENLARILSNDSIPMNVRANVLYSVLTGAMSDIFEKGKGLMDAVTIEKLTRIVRSSCEFFADRGTLKSLIPVLSRDYLVPTHSVHVFIYSAAVFSHYQASAEERVQFGLGSILHDIGKSVIQKMVLYKRGKLNTEERVLFKLHPQKGVGICSQVPLSQTAINTILFHHEKSDGSGYPSGLDTTCIPLHAKIAGIADTFDLLSSGRPHAEPISPSRSLAVIRNDYTGCYDPEILLLFEKTLMEAGMV